MTVDSTRRAFVDKIRKENESAYGDPARKNVQMQLPANYSHPWMYIYELTQNALDAKARRCAWRSDGAAAVFEHDGDLPLDESHVRGMASLGQSTKGLDTVGFMGLGFKSIFARFRRARISGFGWHFKFNIRVRRGDLRAEMPEWFDALRPFWDDDSFDPRDDYTTAFRLEKPADSSYSAADDFNRIASQDDPTPLAVLALRGLEEIRVDDTAWRLSVNDSVVEAKRLDDESVWRWRSFVQLYRPEDDAMRRLLEVRQELHGQNDEEGRWAERQVVALLPLDDDGLPSPPNRGTAYATLPTSERIPFGFHLQADWFVNVDRGTLREISGDAWQDTIVRQLPGILRQFFEWLTTQTDEVRKRGYPTLCEPDADVGQLATYIRDLRSEFIRELSGIPIAPLFGTDVRRFGKPEDTYRLPYRFLDEFGDNSGWAPEILFGLDLIDQPLLGDRATEFADWLEWGKEAKSGDVRWETTLHQWWSAVPEDQRMDALFALWRAVDEHEWYDTPAVPTYAGRWISVHGIRWLDEEPPSANELGGQAVASALADFLPQADQRLPATIRQWVNRHGNDAGPGWLRRLCQGDTLSDLIESYCESVDEKEQIPAIDLARWALNRGEHRQNLVPVVHTENGVCKPNEALLADPLLSETAGKARRALFPDRPALISDYAKIGNRTDVRNFLDELLGVDSGSYLREISKIYYSESSVAHAVGVERNVIRHSNQKRGWGVFDYHFPFDVNFVDFEALQTWLSEEYAGFDGKGRILIETHYYGDRRDPVDKACMWIRDLQELPWLLCEDGQRRRPDDVLLTPDPDFEDASIARIDAGLEKMLRKEGIRFSRNVPKSPALRRLLKWGSVGMPDDALARLLRECLEDVERGVSTQDEMVRALDAVRVQGAPLSRVVERAGSSGRSRGALGGWVVSLSDIDSDLAAAVRAVWPNPIPDTTTGVHALDFLRDHWTRQPPEVDRIRPHLALAYRYVLDDADQDERLAEEWNEAREHAWLYGGRNVWHAAGSRVAVDNVRSSRIRQFLSSSDMKIVSSGQLGDTDEQVDRVARALEVALLSDRVNVSPGEELADPPWKDRLEYLVEKLSHLENRQRLEAVSVHRDIVLRTDVESVGIWAYVQGDILMVVDEPRNFGAEATAQLVEYFRLGQRGGEIGWLTGALYNLDDHEQFRSHVKVLAEGLGFELADFPSSVTPPDIQGPATPPESGMVEKADQTRQSIARAGQGDAEEGGEDLGEEVEDASRRPGQPIAELESSEERPEAPGADGDESPIRSPGGSGEAEARAADWVRIVSMTRRDQEGSEGRRTDRIGMPPQDDRRGRQVVVQYEEDRGWRAEEMPDHQPGYDVLSIDEDTGRRRHIEIKQTTGTFEDEASVVLTDRQGRDAIRNDESDAEYWLYVVDRVRTDSPRVFPIHWTRARLRFGFYARDWVDAADRSDEPSSE